MKVLHVGKYYPPYKGGIELFLRNLCVGLAVRGVDVSVAVANTANRRETAVLDGVRVTRLPSPLTILSQPLARGLGAAMRAEPFDLLHFHTPNPLAQAAYLWTKPPGRVVLSHHSDIIRQSLLNIAVDRLQRRFLKACASVVVATPRHIDSSPLLSDFRDRCCVIPYGIDPGAFALTPGVAAARDELRRRYGSPLTLFVGRLVYYKGVEVLLRAAVNLPGRILVAGSGPLASSLQSLARDLGLGDRAVFLGSPDDAELAALYHACDVFVLPSIANSEGFGIVQVEAMACGKPVVSTDLPTGVPFVNRHEETGLIVPPNDAAALAAALERLLADEPLRVRLGEAGRRRVQCEFHQDVMVQRYLDLYGRVLGARD